MSRSGRSRALAWTLGVTGALACCAGAAASTTLAAPPSFLLVYVVGVLMALLGALVASREPQNSIGWLMCATALAASLVHLPSGYADLALVRTHGAWPLGAFALWFGAWSWVPVMAFLPLISVRFPDGKVPRGWRVVDWLAIAGTACFALGIAIGPGQQLKYFLPIPGSKVVVLSPFVSSPFGTSIPLTVLAFLQGTGLTLLMVGYAASAISQVSRFRRANAEERLQLKWLAYAGTLIAVAFIYGAIAWNFFSQPLYLALSPLEFATLALPVAIGIAILRYRLYDIDLLINRTLVYGSLTAIIGAVYVSVVTFMNRLFISVSGQKSDAAYVVTAFVVAVAFGPIRDWLQRQVDRRVGRTNPTQMLEQFRSSVDAVVAVIDVDRVVHQLVDSAVAAFNARGAALYLGPRAGSGPVYSRGDLNGGPGLEVPLRHDGRDVGLLVIGVRRGGAGYSELDRLALQRSADSVAEAMAVAARLGYLPQKAGRHPKSV